MEGSAATWDSVVSRALDKVAQEAAAAEPTRLAAAPKQDLPRKRGRGKAHKAEDSADDDSDSEDPQALSWWSKPEVDAALTVVPKAFLEPTGKKPYEQDGADRILPEPGFVTDFVNTMRGSEAPTLFLAWGALWTISTALSRQAWFRWYPKPLWPNLYVIFVAPPGLCKKSVSMDIGTTLLRDLWQHLPDAARAYEKSFRFITNKATPDAVNLMLKPERRMFFPGDGTTKTVHRGSRVTVAVSELATFLGKQQYNTGLVNTITDLYDCKDHDSHSTVSRGEEPVKDVYVTFAGAITPMGLEKSIPEEAMGGGLMSRAVLVYQDVPTKVIPIPYALPGYPVVKDLYEKLAWIATHARGEYHLDDEALEMYKAWYMDMKRELFEDFSSHREDEFRKDVILLKLSMLMRIQEYRPGHDITKKNFLDARALLEYTLARSPEATADVGVSEYVRAANRVKKRLAEKGSQTRQQLQQAMSRIVDAELLTRLVNDLTIQGYIQITLDGVCVDRSQGVGRELYELIAQDDNA